MKITICKSAFLCSAALAFALAGQAHAQDAKISYDYIQAGADKGELLDENFSGYSIAGSFSLSNSVFISSNYSDLESDDKFNFGFGFGAVEAELFDLGLGYHAPISSTTDFVTRLSYVRAELQQAGNSGDTNGYGIDLGVRSLVLPNLELEALAVYVDGSDVDGDIGLNLNAKFLVTPALAIVLGYADADETSQYSVGLRYSFK